jgi:hypothetical protein
MCNRTIDVSQNTHCKWFLSDIMLHESILYCDGFHWKAARTTDVTRCLVYGKDTWKEHVVGISTELSVSVVIRATGIDVTDDISRWGGEGTVIGVEVSVENEILITVQLGTGK